MKLTTTHDFWWVEVVVAVILAAIITMASVQLTLFDAEEDELVEIIVTREEADRAEKGKY